MNNVINIIGYILFYGGLIPSGIMAYVGFMANKENVQNIGLIVMLLVCCLMLAGGLWQGAINQ